MEIDNFSFALQTYYSGVNTTPESQSIVETIFLTFYRRNK